MANNTLEINKTHTKEIFPVKGMTCAGCAASVESILKNTEGVHDASVNFADNSVAVDYDTELGAQKLNEALETVGYGLIINTKNADDEKDKMEEDYLNQVKRRLIWSVLLTLPVFVLGMFFPDLKGGKWIQLAFTIPVLFYFGKDFFISALKKAKHGQANMDTLVALSTGIAFLFSLFNSIYPQVWISSGLEAHVYYEAATVIITFITLGKYLEEKAKSGTSTALKKLMGLQPKEVVLVENGTEKSVSIEQVKVGDILRVRPGDKIPVDAIIYEDNAIIDESMITGEPIPVDKSPGDKVFSGTINQKSSFLIEAKKVGDETLLAQIIQTVKEARGSKASVQRLVDKIAAIFVPVVLGISILTFIVWMIFGGENSVTHAFLTSISVLVVACPCALGLATPTAIMVGVGVGAEHNILIRDAQSLEKSQDLDVIVLDKTGTITEGKPKVQDVYFLKEGDEQEYSSIIYELEKRSEHPLATAICDHFKSEGKIKVSNFESLTALGVSAEVNENQHYFIGNKQLMISKNIKIEEGLIEKISELNEKGMTIVYFGDSDAVLGIIAISDTVKESSKKAIDRLHEKGLKVIMLTGDNKSAAAFIADQVGIDSFEAEMTPRGKSDYIKDLQKKGKKVAMVGDGINDSEALAIADVSIAMGKGSDIAMDTAMMTLITSDLNSIPKALRLSKNTLGGIKQNLFWAFIYNIIGIPIAAGILYPINGFLLDPMIAGGAMAMSSVSVVLNSLRLKNMKLG